MSELSDTFVHLLHLGRHGEKTSGAEPDSPIWCEGSGFRVQESGFGALGSGYFEVRMLFVGSLK